MKQYFFYIDADFTEEAAALRDTSCKVVMWDCHDECRYHCMWRTVNVFNENGYDLPKFHGKVSYVVA